MALKCISSVCDFVTWNQRTPQTVPNLLLNLCSKLTAVVMHESKCLRDKLILQNLISNITHGSGSALQFIVRVSWLPRRGTTRIYNNTSYTTRPLKAKFHYTGSTGPDRTQLRATSGSVAWLLESLTWDSKGRGFESRPFRFQVIILGKLFTHNHQAV